MSIEQEHWEAKVGPKNERREVNPSVYRENGVFATKLKSWKEVENRSIYRLVEMSWELTS